MNLSRRQLAIFQKIILLGTEMSEAIKYIDDQFGLPNDIQALEKKWANLMVQFAHMLRKIRDLMSRNWQHREA